MSYYSQSEGETSNTFRSRSKGVKVRTQMKIWCDVCTKKEASVFCSADEACLCIDCDPKVHQANKLASKHPCFSLLQPTSSNFPLCDICQVKKALLFCQQDRAILCRDCDVSIHTANEHTQKHDRFLLTGIKLCSISSFSPANAAAAAAPTTMRLSKNGSVNGGGFDPVPDFKSQNLTTSGAPLSSASSSEITSPLLSNSPKAQPAPNSISTASKDGNTQLTGSNGGNDGSTSSISEYMIEMLPGWQVDDLLDSSSDPFGFCKGSNDDPLFLDTDLSIRDSSFQNMGFRVPQAPALPQPSPFSSNIIEMDGLLEGAKGGEVIMHKKASRKRVNLHDGLTVPQISQQSLGSKRS